jgi:Tfp pilus assembly protein PilF
MGRFPEAEMDLTRALQIDSSFTDAYSGLASMYIFQTKYSDSEKMLKTAYTYDPDNPLISKNLGFLYRFYIQKPESSIVWLNRFLNVASPADREIGLAKSELREMMQRYPEASSIDTSKWGQMRTFVARQKTPFK